MGDFPLIGASASCSSYQKPRRGRGVWLNAVDTSNNIAVEKVTVGL